MNKFEELALQVAAGSKCRKRKVGAVLVCGNTILGQAYNYNTDLLSEECEDEAGITLDTVVHAERHAIDLAIEHITRRGLKNVPDMVLYVTHQPCTACKVHIASFAHRFNTTVRTVVVEEFMKFDTDKLRYDLIPTSTTKALAEVLTYGAKKYKPNNWKSGEVDRYIAALYRHLEAWRSGEANDEESSMSHLAHAITNIAFLIELTKED